MKKFAVLLFGIASLCAFAAPVKIPELLDAVKIDDFTIPVCGHERTFRLPQLPGKKGMIPVLRCRMTSFGNEGCNNCVRIMFNDTPLGMLTASGRPRLLFRDLTFTLPKNYGKRVFKIFHGSNIILPFAADCDDADSRTGDKMGSYHVFDLTDAANPVDVNTVTFRNIRVNLPGNNTLMVKDITVGYLPISVLPKSKFKPLTIPDKSSSSVTAAGTRIDICKNGGFSVSFPGCEPFVAETGIGMKLGAAPTLKALDTAPVQPTSCKILDKNSIELISRWKNAQLTRTLRILPDGKVDWFDKWTNISGEIAAIPFRYHTGLANTETRNYLGGSAEVLERDFANNHTVFYENTKKPGSGVAFSLEDDYSRLILSAVNNNGLIEIFTPVLALPPGKSFTCHYQLHGVPTGGYWAFINQLREVRGLNKTGLERPFFFAPNIPVIPGVDIDERIRRNLGSFGKITVVITPWFGQLGRSVMHKKLPKGASYHDEFMRQRLIDREELGKKIMHYKKLLPEAKIMCLHHHSMRTTYMPEFHRNPFAVSAIRNKDGSPYFHEGYNTIILREKRHQGWSIIYYLPLPGTPWYNAIMEDVDFALAKGADGIYVDEYSFQTPRHYRRYDYSAWDGFSADIDENGKVLALKSDNARTTDLFKTALLQKLTSQDKLFLGNGGDCTVTINCSAGYAFVEGTSLINMPQIHLYNVPLVLGNYGDETTRKGIFTAAREALQMGGIYSPNANTNRFIEGKDNFVCKLYPITIRELGPGFIAAKERFITRHSGTFNWRGAADGEVELFIYDEGGNRIKAGSTGKIVNGKITIEVPKDGMVIAEIR